MPGQNPESARIVRLQDERPAIGQGEEEPPVTLVGARDIEQAPDEGESRNGVASGGRVKRHFDEW